jgi:hypothetical protein
MLHINHGDQATRRLSTLGLPGDFLAWNDVLHEGALPSGLTLEEMSKIRAAFIAGRHWATHMEAQLHFQTRDTILQSGAEAGEVVFWLTPELYDHLHLLQVFTWFTGEGKHCNPPQFVVLHQGFYEDASTDQALKTAFQQRETASDSVLEDCSRLWDAITAPSPRALEEAVHDDALWRRLDDHFPHMKEAIVRLCAEYPDASGLSLTQAYVLSALQEGDLTPFDLFKAVRAQEQAPFMGDASFWLILNEMIHAESPLLTWQGEGAFRPPELMGFDEAFTKGSIGLSEYGKSMQDGQDWLETHTLDRWVGGVRLTVPGCWRFDRAHNRFSRS